MKNYSFEMKQAVAAIAAYGYTISQNKDRKACLVIGLACLVATFTRKPGVLGQFVKMVERRQADTAAANS